MYRVGMAKQSKKSAALLIDANSLMHRAWHALPHLTAPDGRTVNAVYGFASALIKIVAAERPAYLVACWDTPEPTYRHIAKKEYKAQRKAQPDEFYAQMPLAKEVFQAMGGTNVELPGFEADDILATLATRLAKKKVPVALLTSDRDVWQVIGPGVQVMAFKKGVSETEFLDEQGLRELTGLTPTQIVDYKALRGDPSDNLRGVPGIGEKTATDLLLAFGDLNGVFKAAHAPKSKLSLAVRQKLLAGEEEARATLPLVRLVRDAPLEIKPDDLKRCPVDEEGLRRLFVILGFKSLLARVFGEKVTAVPLALRQKELAVTASFSAPSDEEVLDFLRGCSSAEPLFIQPARVAQASLFGRSPGAALGRVDKGLMISAEQLKKKKIAERLGAVLSDHSIKKIGHGLKGVWHWARQRGFDLQRMEFDTEIAAYLLSAGDGAHDLEPLAASRLKIFFPQTENRALAELEAIRALYRELSDELEAEGLRKVYDRFEKPLISVLGRMEERGILINRGYFKGLSGLFQAEKTRLEKEMEGLAGQPFNPGSPQQLAHVLFEVLKISSKGLKRGKTGISTAASELDKLEGAHPIIDKISQYREVAKLLSTYVEALPNLADAGGRVHTTYNQALTATGRLSSSNPNLQNIPIRTELGRKIRRGFIAAEGFQLLSCDYSQIELRVIAALAGDEKMGEAFCQGLDIHTATAASIWKIPLDEVSREQRRAAKTINFGIIYGQGPLALSKGAGISFEEAKEFIAEYFHVYAGVRGYLDNTKALAHARGYVETLFGRRRPIPDINSPFPQLRAAAERMAINMPVQGTSADLIKLAMIDLERALPKISKDARLLLQVHDELVFEVPEGEVKQVTPFVIDIMQNIEKIGVPLVVDAVAGRSWDFSG